MQSSDCLGLAASAACAPPSLVETLCPGGTHTSSLCLAACDITGACSGGATCIEGVCSPRQPPSKDGGVSDANSPPSRDAASEAGSSTRHPDAASEEAGASTSHPDAGKNVDAGAHSDATPQREAGAPTDAAPDASAECRSGYHAVSSGQCRPILFSDGFEAGVLPGQWQLWRRDFVETGGRIQVQDGPPRAGFDYGAAGNGRGAVIATHIDDTSFTDYRLDFDAEVLRAGSYDPYGLSSCTRRFDMYFRVEQMSESWNQPESGYVISVQTKTCDQDVQGTVSFGSLHGYYCPGIGWGCNTSGEGRSLVGLVTPAIVDGQNHYTVEVAGNRTKLWVNGTMVFDYTDDTVPYPPGTLPITHGGIALGWVWELLGWADNLVVTDMR
jgi:hypothetical protein